MLRTSSCSELDICRIHLEEYHELVVCTFNRFIRYTVIFSVHMHLKQWRLRGRESKKPGYIFCSILIVSSSNTALPLIYLKMSSWELTNAICNNAILTCPHSNALALGGMQNTQCGGEKRRPEMRLLFASYAVSR